ncbi:MAG: MBL fold metallo-hydrolase, partial [Bacteroidales bacterium]|nr:MBL fold metallo-hydrolase [Bacteroidales bacterium]
MQITIHRGINQIGGCITEIATRTTKIFIDLGHNLPKGEQPEEDDKANYETIAELTKGVQAIFYTHYHGDHVDLFKFVPNSVQQYIGETAKKIMQIKYERLAKSPRFKKEVTLELLQKLNSFQTFTANKRIVVGNIAVTPYYVSHSACDAYMFLIEETNGLCKRILHTGDFRGHGYTSKGLIPTLKSYILKKPIDVLITEGTMLSRPDEQPMREQDLQKKAMELMKQYKYVFVLCSSTDMERLASFHAASKQAKRSFLCDNYQEDVLKVFSSIAKSPLFQFDNVHFYKHGKQSQFSLIEKTGFCMLIRGKTTHSRYPYTENALQDLLQQLPQEQTLLIYSYWDGYLKSENIIPDFAEVWDMFSNKQQLHTSGHASAECLAEVCQLVNPTTAIIP